MKQARLKGLELYMLDCFDVLYYISFCIDWNQAWAHGMAWDAGCWLAERYHFPYFVFPLVSALTHSECTDDLRTSISRNTLLKTSEPTTTVSAGL